MYLQLRQLTKEFDSIYAVKDLDLDINKGELVSILGPSGCGKTTTLKMIGGFLTPTRGSIILDDVDITNYPPNKRPTSTVFQSYALFPHMNVIQNVIYGLKYKGIGKKEALAKGENMLEIVGLKHYSHKDISQLSGGEQQRVALARALIMNPKVLLLDEPLSNLDAKLRIKMRNEIKNIQSHLGITMLYVTHDQEEALSISDRIVVMNKGKVEQVGTPKEIYCHPKSQFVADFIGRINIIEVENGEKIIVRPENVKLSELSGKYQGLVLQKQFMGAFVTYYVKVENSVIQADVLSNDDKEWLVGESVYLSFSDDAVIKI
ncbi:ABC transporter ATP-binding protein [Caloranaerobacter ferrireducens]|uniref:ABC transporter ATP-binding protein n=1 Tax=Caloranaerobacter ferrireducens TaxID=1323370 RepID=UPI00084D7103|nr:ABC transporter ATP-binding protein [Caloranaerobacter ferrireducens]